MPQTPINLVQLAGGNPVNITTATSTQVKAVAGVLQGLTVNTGGAGSTATLYDGTSTAGVKLATVNTAAIASLTLNIKFKTGLFVVTAGGTAADITVVYV